MALQLGIIMPISGNNKQIRVFLRRKARLLTQCLLLVFFHTVPYVTRESANTCMWILPDNEATGVVYVKKRIYILPFPPSTTLSCSSHQPGKDSRFDFPTRIKQQKE